MAQTNSGVAHTEPTVYKNVTAGDLRTVSGAPARCAARLIFMNGEADDATTPVSPQTAVFQGPDAVNVTVTLPVTSGPFPLDGHFAVLGTLGADVTVIAGWIDDGAFPKNA